MKLVGEYLKSIRIKKKIDLEFISSELNISLGLLKNIEEDYFPDNINDVFLLGHLRSYAKFLEIDDQKIIEDFKIQTSFNNLDNTEKIPKPLKTFDKVYLLQAFSVFSVLIICSSLYLFFVKSNNFVTNYAMTPDLPETFKSSVEEVEMNIELESDYYSSGNKITNNNNEDFIEQNFEKENSLSSSSVVASKPDKQSIDKFNKKITLKFLNPTWVQLRDQNNNILISKLMDKSEEYTYSMSKNITLTAGNAGNIIVLLDGVVVGKAGKLGEVVDSLIIENNFKN